MSTLFLVLFLLCFGIGTFILGNILMIAAAIFAIIAAIFYLIGR